MASQKPLILIIVGVTGDLAARKLLPAVEAIGKDGLLPEDFKIIGTTRRSGAADAPKELTFVHDHLEFLQMDVTDSSAYERLSEHLLGIEKEFGAPAQRLFYLAVPASASSLIIEKLGMCGLAHVADTKLLLEKPFGTDLASATELIEHTGTHFKPEQIYRIDHYLAKQLVQDLLVFRERDAQSRSTWNKDCIERIEITAAEEVGIEGRADFYEQTGALRDLVQSHLLQLAALACMDFGASTQDLPARRLQALQNLHIASDKPLEVNARRGQYKIYREEVKNPASTVETYVSLMLQSDDPHFAGVPILLVTGKKLGAKHTEIRVVYKKDAGTETDELVFADQYAQAPNAYEKVLLDAIRSDHNLFVSSGEVLESWRIIAPVQEAWGTGSADLFFYADGTNPANSH